MLKLILMESIFLLLSFTMGKPVPGQKGGIIPPDSDLNLVPVSLLVGIAALAVLGVAVTVGVVHRSASGDVAGSSDDEFEDPANVVTSIADHEDLSNGRITLDINRKTTRGKDVSWIILQEFDNAPDFFNSNLATKIEKEFTASRKRQFQYAMVTEYRCKFARKKKFQPCPWKLRVLFLSTCQRVQVESTEHCQDHVHEVETGLDVSNPSGNYAWTPQMNDFIDQCISNHGKPKVALRNMEDAGCFENMPRPSMIQLYNKIHAVKKTLNRNPTVGDTFQLRQFISNHLEVPADMHEAYIPFYEIIDDDAKNLRFSIIFSSKNCLAR